MATYQKNSSGTWRAIIRRKGFSTSKSFRRKTDAETWATEIEHNLNQGLSPRAAAAPRSMTIAELVDLHVMDMCEVGKAPRRSKAYCMEKLKQRLGTMKAKDVTKEFLISFAKCRHREGAGPVTISMDIGYLKTVIDHAASLHDLPLSTECFNHARKALQRLDLVGKSDERDRRPTRAELERLYAYFDGNPRQIIPMSRLVRFSGVTAMRQEEISLLTWGDLDEANRTIMIRQRKDPRRKRTNDQIVPLVDLIGECPIQIMHEKIYIFTICDMKRPAAYSKQDWISLKSHA